MASRTILFAVLAVIIAGASFGAGWVANSMLTPPARTDKVIMTTDWILWGYTTPFFVAKDQGFYSKEGLEVDVLRGVGSADTVTKVGAGVSHFGLSDAGTVQQVIAKGADVKIVQMYTHTNALGLRYIEEKTPIKSAKDLEGKTVGEPTASAIWQMFPVFAQKANIDINKVNHADIAAGVTVSSLLAGKVDSIGGNAFTTPTISIDAAKQGLTVKNLVFSDYGLNLYGYAILSQNKLIKDNPDLVQRFVRATTAAVVWSIKNPDKAIEIYKKYNPEADLAIHTAVWKATIPYLMDDLAKQQGYGYMDDAKMKITVDTVNQVFSLSVKPDQVYTNDFVSKVPKEQRLP
ncbi:MAG: ABC transporter substrate-binding protein [Thaumarchaeota archaeon]|nr:ABC transporter substrate-binding protein [Nitrososphaerota archaeon]